MVAERLAEPPTESMEQTVIYIAISLAIGILVPMGFVVWRVLSFGAEEEDKANVRHVDCRPWGLGRVFKLTEAGGAAEFEADGGEGGTALTGALRLKVGRGAGAFGLSIWDSSLALSKYLVCHHQSLSVGALAPGCSVLELGCGQPLVTMVIAATFPELSTVIATDGHEAVLKLARRNLLANEEALLPVAGSANKPSVSVTLTRLLWGCNADEAKVLEINGGNYFDLIIGADVTYNEDLGHKLLATVRRVSHKESCLLLAHERRPGSRIDDGYLKFLEQLRQAYLKLDMIAVELDTSEVFGQGPCTVEIWSCSQLQNLA